MEIIEKQVEKTKEVPYGYWENCGYGGYGYGRNVNGKMIEGQVVLPNTPTVTGFGSYCCCKCLNNKGWKYPLFQILISKL